MSDERIEKARREAWESAKQDQQFWDQMNIDIAGTMIVPSFNRGFASGFLAGRADALTMPEVRADELEEGKSFPQEGVAR